MKRALLLNANYEPLHFVSDRDAIVLYYRGSAEIVSNDGVLSQWEETFNSPSTIIKIPATLRLLKHFRRKWKRPRFQKKVLFNRDNWQCQYCSTKLNSNSVTIDHICPSSRGGETTWINCVTSCKQCNRRKSNKTLVEADMKLLKQPEMPTPAHFWDTQKSSAWHEDWDFWISRDTHA